MTYVDIWDQLEEADKASSFGTFRVDAIAGTVEEVHDVRLAEEGAIWEAGEITYELAPNVEEVWHFDHPSYTTPSARNLASMFEEYLSYGAFYVTSVYVESEVFPCELSDWEGDHVAGEDTCDCEAIDRSAIGWTYFARPCVQLKKWGKVWHWHGQSYTAAHLVEVMIADRELSPAARDMDIEDVLTQYREVNGWVGDGYDDDPEFAPVAQYFSR